MIDSRFIVSLTALSLFGAVSATMHAQDEQQNNYNGTGSDFDDPANWEDDGGPDTWTVDLGSGAQDLNEGGISFDVEQTDSNPFLINVNLGIDDLIGYEKIGDINVLGDAAVLLFGDPARTTYFQFGASDEILTGEGALAILNIDLHLDGNFTFNFRANRVFALKYFKRVFSCKTM